MRPEGWSPQGKKAVRIMAKKRAVKKTKVVRFSLLAEVKKILRPSLAKIGIAVGLTALSLLYNGKAMNYYVDPVMRGFPLAILTFEQGTSCLAGAICTPSHYQVILLSILVDAVFYYLVMGLLVLGYKIVKGKHRNG
jgi:hypothetical protein